MKEDRGRKIDERRQRKKDGGYNTYEGDRVRKIDEERGGCPGRRVPILGRAASDTGTVSAL